MNCIYLPRTILLQIFIIYDWNLIPIDYLIKDLTICFEKVPGYYFIFVWYIEPKVRDLS